MIIVRRAGQSYEITPWRGSCEGCAFRGVDKCALFGLPLTGVYPRRSARCLAAEGEHKAWAKSIGRESQAEDRRGR